MRNVIAGLAAVSSLLLLDPAIDNVKASELIKNTKSKISLILNGEQIGNYTNLVHHDDNLNIVIEQVLVNLEHDIDKELKKGGFDSFIEILSLIDKNPKFIFESTILNSTIRETGGSKGMREIIHSMIEKKYGDKLYDIVNEYFFYVLLNKILEGKVIENFFLDEGKEKFYELDNDIINIFEKMGISLNKNIGDFQNFSFIIKDGGVILGSLKDNEIVEIGTISNYSINYLIQDIFDIIYFIEKNSQKSISV